MRTHVPGNRKLAFRIAAAVVVIGTIGAAALFLSLGYWRSAFGLEATATERIWPAVSCRAGLYVRKVRGGMPDLSWIELWDLTLPGRGFYCGEGGGMEAGVRYSSVASDADRKAGGAIFRQRCTGCHGSDGSGGSHAPSLTRSSYKHGDSDLAIYKVLRDGVPGTAMPSAALSVGKLLQVTAYLKILQADMPEDAQPDASRPVFQVTTERLRAAGTRTDEWLTYSGSYNGWRHSPLDQVTPANVGQLRLRWVKQFDSTFPRVEATPLVVDGTIFTTGDASHVLALNAKTGDIVWELRRPDPTDLASAYGRVNRGLAVYGNTLFFGSLDGHLIAIGGNDGKVEWQTSVASASEGYSMTAAPLVVNQSVIVGVSGGEFRARGFLAAYDVATGRQQWRFNTIPGPGEAGHESWENGAWRTGGGGTWITGGYDPSTDLLYWGVGNPSPAFSGDVRPGDNLFTDSVIALHASTGKLAWHFQFTPHDEHDRDSAQTPVLADLPIKGVPRKVICWPNRNGFYYVLDRETGEFLAGVPFVAVDWAKGLSPTGRPILADAAQVTPAGRSAKPGIDGGTNWQNPAFDPARGAIFIAATESSSVFTKLPPDQVTTGEDGLYLGGGWNQVGLPTRRIIALDAATGQRKWAYDAPSSAEHSDLNKGSNYSGLLTTAGGLVFGASGGSVFALDADTGRELWRVALGGNTAAAPISFTIDGRQVIAVAVGRALFVFGLE